MSPAAKIRTSLNKWFGRVAYQVEHKHVFRHSRTVEHADCGDGSHTSFHVIRCGCGASELYPLFNYQLTTQAYKDRFLDEMKRSKSFLL